MHSFWSLILSRYHRPLYYYKQKSEEKIILKLPLGKYVTPKVIIILSPNLYVKTRIVYIYNFIFKEIHWILTSIYFRNVENLICYKCISIILLFWDSIIYLYWIKRYQFATIVYFIILPHFIVNFIMNVL